MSANNTYNTRITMTEWSQRVEAFLKYGIASQKALICEGEAGCGKSEVTKQVCERVLGAPPIVVPGLGAQQQEELLSAIKLVEREDGSAEVIQGVIETLMPTAKLASDPRYQLNGRPCIPWIIDEIWTGNMSQMNQIRAALTFRQIGGARLPEGVFILGTTNPLDAVYSSRKNVDSAVMDRVETYSVYMTFDEHQQFLIKECAAGRYPESCRLFLQMDENSNLWDIASARFWYQQFGQTWLELSSSGLPPNTVMKLFTAAIDGHFQCLAANKEKRGDSSGLPMSSDALVARFQNFIKHGDDPHYYPISCNKIINIQDEVEADIHCDLLDYWAAQDQHSFIGVTIQDLERGLKTVNTLSELACVHVTSLLCKVGIGLVTNLCKCLYSDNPNIMSKLEPYMAETDLSDRVSEALSQQCVARDAVKKERRGRVKASSDWSAK